MKKGIEMHGYYDVNDRWCLTIAKKKGKLSIDEIKEVLREYDEDYYLLVIDAISDMDFQFDELPFQGDIVELYKIDSLTKQRS